ncbi:MAG: pseudouridine synthase [Proteocatella sp.]
MRLNKYIAEAGITSRRKADELIKNGDIEINGEITTELGIDVKENDIVKYRGKIISKETHKIYVMLNKPPKYLSSVTDDRDRKTVIDLIKGNYHERLYPVGRLDYDTEGLLLLTNDGEITNKLTHPSHQIKKTYFVRVDKPITEKEKRIIEKGVVIDDYLTRECSIELSDKNACECLITIGEGKNRQIRKMFYTQNLEVMYLKRISIGEIKLGSLALGETRELTKNEVNYLKSVN